MDDLRIEPRRYGPWRARLVRAFEVAGRALGARRRYVRRFLAAERLQWRAEEVPVAGLAPAFDGFTIAHLSDLHAGPWLSGGDLGAVVDGVRARRPDLVALTGDFLTHAVEDVEPLLGELRALAAPHGAWAVFGNHDYRGRREVELTARLAQAGVRVLRDEGVRLQRAGAGLGLVGLEDLEESRGVHLDRARAGVAPGEPWIALCHHPGGAAPLARAGAALVLSGHTHGRQLDLPGLRHLGPAHPGARVDLGGATLVVSRGLGVTGLPWRVGAAAEVVVVRLRRV